LEDDKAYVVNENHEWFRNRLALGIRSKHSHIEWCSSRGGAMGYFALGLEIAPPRGDKSRGTWVDFEMDSEYCGQLINDCSSMRVDESLAYRPSRLCELESAARRFVFDIHFRKRINVLTGFYFQEITVRWNINGLRFKKISVPAIRYDTSFWWEFDHGTNKTLTHFVSDKQSKSSSDWIIVFTDGEFHQLYIELSLESDYPRKTQLQLMNIQCRGLISTCLINLTRSSNHFG
jgi:hypothetical protein